MSIFKRDHDQYIELVAASSSVRGLGDGDDDTNTLLRYDETRKAKIM